MFKFVKILFWFALPILITVTPVVWFLSLTGENYCSIREIVKSKEKHLIGYAYNENNYRYLKWKTITENNKKDIWALGSSRVLQFRSNMFNSEFYNAGYTINSISDFQPFLEGIPKDKYPETIIVGLDQWMFNKEFDDLKVTKPKEYWQNSFSYCVNSAKVSAIFKDLKLGKYDLSIISNRYDEKQKVRKIGLNALVNNKGFRNDGSMYYGSQINKLLINDSTANDFNYSSTFKRIADGNRRFEYGNSANTKAFKTLNEFLDFCSENKIKVVGFSPPFANKVNKKMDKTGSYHYIDSLFNLSREMFLKKGFELWDMQNLKDFGSNDEETIDGYHGGELTYLKMLIYMLKHKSLLNNYANVIELENDLIDAQNRFLVYDY